MCPTQTHTGLGTPVTTIAHILLFCMQCDLTINIYQLMTKYLSILNHLLIA